MFDYIQHCDIQWADKENIPESIADLDNLFWQTEPITYFSKWLW